MTVPSATDSFLSWKAPILPSAVQLPFWSSPLLSDQIPQEGANRADSDGYSAAEAKKRLHCHPYTPPFGRVGVGFQQPKIVRGGPVKVGLE
jgi:hypothetical protein